jgi:hypothetical protein
LNNTTCIINSVSSRNQEFVLEYVQPQNKAPIVASQIYSSEGKLELNRDEDVHHNELSKGVHTLEVNPPFSRPKISSSHSQTIILIHFVWIIVGVRIV